MDSHLTEQNLLGAIMFLKGFGDTVDEVLDLLNIKDFCSQTHKHIFQAMVDLKQKGINPDVNAVTQHRFCDDGYLYIYETLKNTSSGYNLKAYAEHLKKLSELRTIQQRVNSINELISKPTDLDTKLNAISSLFDYETGITNQTDGAKHISECLQNYLSYLDDRWNNSDKVLFSSGLTDLDKILGGGYEIGLHAIAANPKMGKTELMAKIINHFGIEKKLPVYVGSMEMQDFQVVHRLISSYAKLAKQLIMNNFNDDNDPEKTSESLFFTKLEDYRAANIYIDDKHDNSVSRIRREARKITRKHGYIGGIFVDYLQLMESDRKYDRRDLEVGAMTRALKGMSKEFQCPVIMLLQLNRGNTSRIDKRPVPSDSRDSGAVEQDVDSWIGLYRDSVFNTNSPWKNITEILVKLNRHGETGTCYQKLTSMGFIDVQENEIERLINNDTKLNVSNSRTANF
ncbi:hypothetical protein FM038_001605 [Shewanella eurypsychrophilus]|uniref:DNA 5'-3' helicase n=1 Tax=Shewanella eurypsychrophilus TaxID=2593656 RepID=A0ABX6V1K9_9GAMM|nr:MULTISPECIES: DnaB-like helicase C-terminal domain-containing protein [Shewanella]QPG56263.2 hypothetical protein FM038_001605 [Shewanella eurypsychrophilus]